jgi:zinc transport system permease protein
MTFGQRALLAAVMLGATAPLIGTFLVRRGMALVGDGLGHVAFAGVALAVLVGIAPLPVALLAALAGAAGIELLRWKSSGRSDLAIAFVFYTSIALGVVALATANKYNARVLGVLFGSLLTISNSELVTMAASLAVVAATTIVLFRPLVAISIDDELAAASGISPRTYGMVISLATAVAVVAGMPAVGVLLISALLILPAAAAHNFVSGFGRSLAASSLLGAASSVAGTAVALRANLPPGASIVVVSAAIYVASLVVRRN